GDRAWEVADPQAVMKIGSAAPKRIADFDQELASGGEGVREAGIGLQARRIIAIGVWQLTPGFGVVELDPGVEIAAKPPAEHLEAQPLSGRDGELVKVTRLSRYAADDDAGRRHRQGGLFGPEAAGRDDLGQGIEAKWPEIR